MFTNPFAGLTEIMPAITPGIMQAFVVLMALLVVVGTILDTLHKKSAEWFYEYTDKMSERATRPLGSNEKMNLAIQTVASEVLTSSEFHNPKRRIAHLLKMYGFVIFALSSAVLIFFYSGEKSAGFWAFLWRLGAIMLAVGSWWFFTKLRVNVQSEGDPWYTIDMPRDMFIVSLMGVSTFGLLWCISQNIIGSAFLAGLFFVLFVLSAILLFGGVYWSKFAHMFFKPFAAYQKRVFMADGSREKLPPFYKRSEVLQESTMDLVRDIPANQKMGLCIRKDDPSHY